MPEQKIKLRHGDLLLVSGLPDNIRLNYLRWGEGSATGCATVVVWWLDLGSNTSGSAFICNGQ